VNEILPKIPSSTIHRARHDSRCTRYVVMARDCTVY